uniref:Putative GHMP kinase family protein n=1 Tax=viral metagenome TaxID=1070528 RepID=A0A6M3L6I8_9ZZZZ
MELVNDNNDIQHPVINALINNEGLHRGDYSNTGFEVYHFSDMPAFRGLGSSSAFAVGLLNAWGGLYHPHQDKEQLAVEAIMLEQMDLKENVGCQDQWLCALGGVNYLRFPAGRFGGVSPHVEKLSGPGNTDTIAKLSQYIMLVDTKTMRVASYIASTQIDEMPKHEDDMLKMVSLAEQGKCLLEEGDLDEFAKLLHESWQIKKSLSPKITFPEAEHIYDLARKHGALGGKVIGAGGGGYFLLLAEPDTHKAIKEALEGYKCIDNIGFDYEGATVIYKDGG